MLRFRLTPEAGTRQRLHVLLSWLGVLGLAGLGFLLSCIGWEVRRLSNSAMCQFGGDRVMALARLVDGEDIPLNRKNEAVWALGQLGDARALSTLEKWYYGGPCNHDSTICQYELKKAIAKCRGGVNFLAPTWRWAVQPTDSLKVKPAREVMP